MVSVRSLALAALPLLASGQTFQRLGTCPTFGCVLPPTDQDFLPGQKFDIRVEVHAPVNGTEAANSTSRGVPNTNFQLTIKKVDSRDKPEAASSYFDLAEPKLENWTFSWYEDLFAQDAKKPSVVNVASKAWRSVALYEPGDYDAVLTYNNGTKTTARWTVRDVDDDRKAKNVILFIGDGMTTNMITAARLIGHKSVNGRYQTTMAMDKFPSLGHSMTHSVDTFITDSANSATALYSGHKSSVNALGCYVDSSPDVFDDPKVESMMEIFYRLYKGGVGIVTTAFLADATPGAVTAHTRARSQYPYVIDSLFHGTPNYTTWTKWDGADVILGGGAEQFCKPAKSGLTYMNQDYYQVAKNMSYSVVNDKTQLAAAPNDKKLLGVFSESNMAKWLDRNVYTANVNGNKDSPLCNGADANNQPGLKEMTLKAIDVLSTRGKKDGNGFFLMSEAASIDKQMHALDYDRALGELLELDDTIKATLKHLEEIGELEDTLIVVTADHGHGFDVFGSVDTKYLNQATGDRNKRKSVGTYQNSGLSQYINTGSLMYADSNFPSNWDPRYTLAQGFGANPDHRENYQVHKDGPRFPATNITGYAATDYYVNYKDAPTGFIVNGTLPTNAEQGVHSLTDVPVFAQGPGAHQFTGVYNNIEIFYKISQALGMGRTDEDDDDNRAARAGRKGYHN